MYQEALSRQLALDYCCSPADVADSKNHFTIYVPQEGRRRFQEQTVCRLKIAVVNGKIFSYRFRGNCGRMSETLCRCDGRMVF